MTSQQRKHRCPFPHNFGDKLGVSFLAPSPSPRPLLDLMGVKDEELQDHLVKSHPYALRSSVQVKAHNLNVMCTNMIILFLLSGPWSVDKDDLFGRVERVLRLSWLSLNR